MPDTKDSPGDPKFSLAAEMLHDYGEVRLKAWGTSMLPSVWPGDLLTIQSVAHEEVVPGEIVLVLRESRFLIHRLVERRKDVGCISWITRGDAMPHNDPPAAASELLGRVTGIRRGNRIFVPCRRVSLLHSAFAWALCHSDRFRNLTLLVRAARLQAGVRGVTGTSRSHTSHRTSHL
jgi:Peptidase S24-like